MTRNLKHWLLLIYISINSTFGQNSGDTFSITPDNTKIEFKAKHFGVINVSGSFTSFSGEITISDDIVTSGKITIDVSSINTANNSRDRSLKDKEFLDADGYPFITVSFDKNSKSTLVSSLITIKEKSISIPISYELSTRNENMRSIQAHCNISRNLFNLNFGSMDDLISDKIDISVFVTLKAK